MDHSLTMSVPSELQPILERHNLVAFITNEGWVLIRRMNYIDLYIKDEPYCSVEILFHTESKARGMLET